MGKCITNTNTFRTLFKTNIKWKTVLGSQWSMVWKSEDSMADYLRFVFYFKINLSFPLVEFTVSLAVAVD